jgi:hypothetical protein
MDIPGGSTCPYCRKDPTGRKARRLRTVAVVLAGLLIGAVVIPLLYWWANYKRWENQARLAEGLKEIRERNIEDEAKHKDEWEAKRRRQAASDEVIRKFHEENEKQRQSGP